MKFYDALLRDPQLAVLEYEKCKRDPWHWLTNWVWTLDTHDKVQPVKRFPDSEYLKFTTEIWLRETLLLIPKSRQMMLTWLIVALYLWDAQFHLGRYIFFQSKKEKDADDILSRAKFMFNNQPYFLKPKNEQKYCQMSFPSTNSLIRAIPQGGDQIRMHTASGLFIDEAAFQHQAEEAFTAAKPSIDGGGKVTMVSSANPGFFEMLVHDKT